MYILYVTIKELLSIFITSFVTSGDIMNNRIIINHFVYCFEYCVMYYFDVVLIVLIEHWRYVNPDFIFIKIFKYSKKKYTNQK